MEKVLGFDTSNYTTSVALVSEYEYRHSRKILDVDKGERGLRQSNALFLHTKNLYDVIDNLDINKDEITSVSVSDKPRDEEGSYMPCFLAGVNAGKLISKVLGVPYNSFSHQAGHIMAILISSNRLDLLNKEFIAYHISGGTTELVYCTPNKEKGFKVQIIGGTKDLSCGQLIDRCGVKLGYNFPCGQSMEDECHFIALDNMKIRLDGSFFNLSGIENKFCDMVKNDVNKEEIMKYVFSVCSSTIIQSVMNIRENEKYMRTPVLFAGGVMRNRYIRDSIQNSIDNISFGSIELSSDNAVGVAYLGLYKERGLLG